MIALIVAAIAAIFLLIHIVVIHIVGIARRDTQYRAILTTYSDVLKPGTKRSEVENYFIMSKYVSFRLTEEHEDSVQIAHEGTGRVCQEQLVYFTFEFATVEPK